jgi:hypothetical protein
MTLTHADGFRLVRAGGAIDEIDFGGPAPAARRAWWRLRPSGRVREHGEELAALLNHE